jgi:hypothetical protein
MNIPDHFSESLETIFGLKILKFFDADSDPGSGIFLTLSPGSGMKKIRIWDKHPGFATGNIAIKKERKKWCRKEMYEARNTFPENDD